MTGADHLLEKTSGFGRVLRRLVCLLGRHHRLGRAVRWDGYDFRSICRYCGAPMVKHGNVRWRALSASKDTLLLTYVPDEATSWPRGGASPSEAPTEA